MAICKPTTLASKYGSTILSTQSTIFQTNTLSFADIIKSQSNPVEAYDRDTLLKVTSGLNLTLRRVDLSSYPTLGNRISQGNILYTEIGDFLNQSSFDINEVNLAVSTFASALPTITQPTDIIVSSDRVTSGVSEILDQLDFYYTENAANNISGGFCAAFANPFGQILEVVGAIQVGQDLLSKLLSFNFNFSLADLLSPLNVVKEMLLKTVDKLKETLQAQLDSITSSITATLQNVKDSYDSAMSFFNSKIQDVKTFMKNLSIDSIKQSIEDIIDNAIKQFEELTPEAIALLMFRFCQFSEMIQSFMKAPVDGLRNLANSYATSIAFQNSRGLQQTSRAVAAGATRFDEDARRRLRQEASSRASPNADRAVDPRDRGPDGEYYASVEELSPTERASLTNLTSSGIPGKFTFGSGVTDMDGDLGFTEVEPKVWAGLLKVVNRLQRMGVLSGPVLINSAHRSKRYNDALSKRTKGVAKNSLHITGLALDVSMRGLGGNDFERQFIRVASQEGFTAIGVYNTFIHIDMRDYERNYWPEGTRHQKWLVSHFKDAYRTGAAASEQDDDVTVATSGPQ